VYGTLRLGSQNQHAERLAKGARHIGLASMCGRLHWLGDYLALVPSDSKEDRVPGDVFEGVTPELFERLDEYERAEYARQLGEVTMQDGRTFAAYFYCYAGGK
jgi:gamma-glutamylcyclotransferase (GGCT)/AIG2-like uncharacterized protein YtfP